MNATIDGIAAGFIFYCTWVGYIAPKLIERSERKERSR